MANIYRIHWLGWQPTPYNDVLFSALANDPEIDLTVHYRFSVLDSHPWKANLAQGYKRRFYQDDKSSFYIDSELIKLAIKEKDSIFVLTGWPGLTPKFLLLTLILFKRKFFYWSDTPNVRYQKKETKITNIKEFTKFDCPYPLVHSLLRKLLYRLIFIYSNGVMSTGKPGVDAMSILGCTPSKIINLPFFVSLSDLNNNGFERLKENTCKDFIFVSSGQLVYRKRYDVAIKALSIVSKSNPAPFQYILLGEGPERISLERLINELGLFDKVKILGWQEPDRIKQLLSESNAFVHPAQNDPFPVAVLEAMAAGLPILGSDASGSVLDRVMPGKNGFIHPAGNADILAEHMINLLTNKPLEMQMRYNARKTAEEWPVSRGVNIIKKIIK